MNEKNKKKCIENYEIFLFSECVSVKYVCVYGSDCFLFRCCCCLVSFVASFSFSHQWDDVVVVVVVDDDGGSGGGDDDDDDVR